MKLTKKNLELVRKQLEFERSSFIAHYKDLADYILPRRGRFFLNEANRGYKVNQKIIDSTATRAQRTTRSGLMSGVTSPSRPWFKLETPDPDINELGPVKTWLEDVTRLMNSMFLRSNLYNILPIVYGDLVTFGTGCMFVARDMDRVIHCQAFPVGSYMLSKDSKGRINTFIREFRMTVRQIVERFGRDEDNPQKIDWSNISDHVKSQYENHHYETWIDVTHVILPNDDYIPDNPKPEFQKYASIYYERGYRQSGTLIMGVMDDDRILERTGYDMFRVLAPRWEVTAEDIYGTNCPGMTALGDVKALQTMQKRKAQAVEKMINPAMVGSASLQNTKATLLPGDTTYLMNDTDIFKPAHEIRLNVGELRQDILDTQQSIRQTFYEDLFLALATDNRNQRATAAEIRELREEKFTALGPVLEQLNQDLLDPLIDIAFADMVYFNMVPEPPDEIVGIDLDVQYVSVMAQAQKLVSRGTVDAFTGYVGQLAQFNPEVADKFDFDQAVDVYADILGVPTSIVRPDAEAAELRQQRAEAQQRQAQMEQMQALTKGAKDLSETNLEGDNALNRVLGQTPA